MNESHLTPIDSVWMIEDRFAASALRAIEGIDFARHVAEHRAAIAAARQARQSRQGGGDDDDDFAPQRMDYDVDEDGVAELDISGPLTKQPNSMQSLFGGTSTVLARQALRRAVADPQVKAIMLHIESPGGQSQGTPELACDVAAAAAAKPTWAYIEDLGASAAYMVAASAGQVYCNASALVGCIGTYMVMRDSSEAAKQDGVKVQVVKNKAGAMKGLGVPGTPITDEQLAEQQRVVESINDRFVESFAAGRKMPPAAAAALADGRVHVGQEAVKLGLADGVDTYENVREKLAAVANAATPGSPPDLNRNQPPQRGAMCAQKETPMATATSAVTAPATAPTSATTTTEPKPATIAELKAAFPKDPSFALECAEKALTTTEAKAAYADVLIARLAESEKKNAKRPGGPGVVDQSGAASAAAQEQGSDAVTAWKAAVNRHVAAGMHRSHAAKRVVQENPELHLAYLQATNTGRRAQLLEDYLASTRDE
jgi:signal peptide peptidase SppA